MIDKLKLVAVALMLIPCICIAQVTHGPRIEIEHSREDIKISSLGKNGLIVAYPDKGGMVAFQKYDTMLKLEWTKTIKADFIFSGKSVDDVDMSYHFLTYAQQGKFIIYSPNQSGELTNEFEDNFGRGTSLLNFAVYNGIAYVIFDHWVKDEATLLLWVINLKSKSKAVVQLPVRDNFEKLHCSYNNKTNAYNVCLYVEKDKKLYFKSISPDGTILNAFDCNALINGKILSNVIITDGGMIWGTYSFPDGGALGIFNAPFNWHNVGDIKYYSITDFGNFFKEYTSVWHELVENKKIDFNLGLQNVVEDNSGFFVQTEVNSLTRVFAPDPQKAYDLKVAYWESDFGQPKTRRLVAFGMFGRFDTTGNKIWDNCLGTPYAGLGKMDNRIQYFLKGNEFRAIYVKMDTIFSKDINGQSTPDKPKQIVLNASSEDCKPKYDWLGFDDFDTKYWYDNNFIAYGWERLKCKSGMRNVLFINKLTYQ